MQRGEPLTDYERQFVYQPEKFGPEPLEPQFVRDGVSSADVVGMALPFASSAGAQLVGNLAARYSPTAGRAASALINTVGGAGEFVARTSIDDQGVPGGLAAGAQASKNTAVSLGKAAVAPFSENVNLNAEDWTNLAFAAMAGVFSGVNPPRDLAALRAAREDVRRGLAQATDAELAGIRSRVAASQELSPAAKRSMTAELDGAEQARRRGGARAFVEPDDVAGGAAVRAAEPATPEAPTETTRRTTEPMPVEPFAPPRPAGGPTPPPSPSTPSAGAAAGALRTPAAAGDGPRSAAIEALDRAEADAREPSPVESESEDIPTAFREMGGAITENLYHEMWDRLERGKLPEPFHSSQQSPFAQRVRRAYDAGEIRGPDDLRRWANEPQPSPARSRLEQPDDAAAPDLLGVQAGTPHAVSTPAARAQSRRMTAARSAPEDFPEAPADLLRVEGREPRTGELITATLYRGYGRRDKGSVYAEGVDQAVLGEAGYFAVDEATARQFGPEIEQREITLRNPYVITAHDDLTAITGAAFPVTVEQYRQQMTGLRSELERRGHDGVLVQVPAFADVDGRGRNAKRLRSLFGDTQVIAFGEAAAPAPTTPSVGSVETMAPAAGIVGNHPLSITYDDKGLRITGDTAKYHRELASLGSRPFRGAWVLAKSKEPALRERLGTLVREYAQRAPQAAPTGAQPASSRRVLSRQSIEDRLVAKLEEQRAIADPAMSSPEMFDAGEIHNPFNFAGSRVPREVLEHFEKQKTFGGRNVASLFKTDVSGGMGENTLAELGMDRYARLLESRFKQSREKDVQQAVASRSARSTPCISSARRTRSRSSTRWCGTTRRWSGCRLPPSPAS